MNGMEISRQLHGGRRRVTNGFIRVYPRASAVLNLHSCDLRLQIPHFSLPLRVSRALAPLVDSCKSCRFGWICSVEIPPSRYNAFRLRSIRYIPLAFLCGAHGFALFAPYVLL